MLTECHQLLFSQNIDSKFGHKLSVSQRVPAMRTQEHKSSQVFFCCYSGKKNMALGSVMPETLSKNEDRLENKLNYSFSLPRRRGKNQIFTEKGTTKQGGWLLKIEKYPYLSASHHKNGEGARILLERCGGGLAK